QKSDTPGWQQALARRAIDAGAATFVAHGVPELQGIEYYRGAPLFHGLSSFIFQSEKPDDAYGPEAWQSVIAELDTASGRVTDARLIPVVLDPAGAEHDGKRVRGSPRLAEQGVADAILEHLVRLSGKLAGGAHIEKSRPG